MASATWKSRAAEDLERAINERTVMMHFFNTNDPAGKIKLAEFAAIGKKHGIPTLNDIAADVPPVENLSKSIKLGYDLVAVSGGKGLRGPQSCGLLFGREDLIRAARLNGPPNSDAIGRGMKVNKEEMLGMMVALEILYQTRSRSGLARVGAEGQPDSRKRLVREGSRE